MGKCIFELEALKITQIHSFMKNKSTKIDEIMLYSLFIFVDAACQALKKNYPKDSKFLINLLKFKAKINLKSFP